MKTSVKGQEGLGRHDYLLLQMQTSRSREAERLAVKCVHGRAKAEVSMRAPFLLPGLLWLWLLWAKVEETARRPGE